MTGRSVDRGGADSTVHATPFGALGFRTYLLLGVVVASS